MLGNLVLAIYGFLTRALSKKQIVSYGKVSYLEVLFIPDSCAVEGTPFAIVPHHKPLHKKQMQKYVNTIYKS